MGIKAVRGATTVDEDTKDKVIDATAELLREMMERNSLSKADLISIVFTATPDISSEFPAAATRSMSISDIPLLCAREMDVQAAVPMCIRILMHVETDKTYETLRHVYLRNAQALRTDLRT